MAKYAFGRTSLDRMVGVHPDLVKVAHRALVISGRRKNGIDFTIPIHGGKRTAEEQKGLFDKGVSKADGYEKKSYHQTGFALDVIPYVKAEGIKGNAIYSKKVSTQKRELYFHMVASCILEAAAQLGVKISWGGNWKTFTDFPHYQIPRDVVQ